MVERHIDIVKVVGPIPTRRTKVRDDIEKAVPLSGTGRTVRGQLVQW